MYAVDGILRMHCKVGNKAKLVVLHPCASSTDSDFSVTDLQYTVLTPTVHFGGNITTVTAKYQYLSLCNAAGQLCFINIPAISRFQWHPFTVSSMPGDQTTGHHIKVMKQANGSEQWTEQLYKLALDAKKNHTSLESIQINIEGPYGLPLPSVGRYTHMLLVAGGIGITPMQAHFRQICRSGIYTGLVVVKLIWTTRSVDEANLFAKKVIIIF